MMAPMPSNILREFNITGEDTTPPLTAVPADLHVTAAREGGPMVCEARLAFLNVDGAELSAGSATVQWYAVVFMDPKINVAAKAWPFPLLEQATVRLEELGGTTSLDTDADEIVMPDRVWLWPVIHAVTLPVQQVVRVTVGDDADGTYSIQVDTGEVIEDPVEVDAVGLTIEQIRDQLVAGLAASEYVTAEADPDEDAELVITGALGASFMLVLSAPGDALTQADDPSPTSPAVKGRVYFHAARPWINRGE